MTLATLLAFVQFGLGRAGAILAGLIAIDQVLGNFVDPRLQGRTLGVFALVLLAGDLLAWLWGIAGAFLAVPLTVTIILVCPHVPALEPIAVLLGRRHRRVGGGPALTPPGGCRATPLYRAIA